MIELSNICKTYHSASPLPVLKGINLKVEEGELVSIMGASGSGKSTMLNIIGILDTYDEGEYRLAGTLIKGLSEDEASILRNRLIGFIFQSFNLIGFKNAMENVALPLYYRGVPREERNERAMEYLKMMGLQDHWNHRPNELSGGQCQRVAIARALISQPKIILADEPTGALDSKTTQEVMDILVRLNREYGQTMVIVTHESDIAAQTDRRIFLKDGVIFKDERKEATAPSMRDLFSEIFASLSHSRTRFLLTGISTAWGIFLLIVLLGVGNGILNGVSNAWLGEDDNVVTLEPSTTMLPYAGLPAGRSVFIDADDGDFLREAFPGNISACVNELDKVVQVSCGAHHAETDIAGFYPGYRAVRNNIIVAGRDINDMDIARSRKVCVLSTNLCKRLFPGQEPAQIVGRTVSVHNVAMKVAGVYKPARSYNVSRTIIAPFTTVKGLYFEDNHISRLSVIVEGLESEAANRQFVDDLRTALATRKGFNPQDKKAVTITNTYDLFLYINGLFSTINIFLWIVGLSTLIAGVVGVSNIMLITVRERTREFAVRKAMGASRRSIITLVLTEAVMVTLIFGYIGMVLGIGVLKLTDFLVSAGADPSQTGVGSSIFMNPGVDIRIILGATLIMVISGLLAGYMPARRAVSIKLVEALAANE